MDKKKVIELIQRSEEDYAFMAASENEPLYLLPHVLEVGKIERVGNKFDKK